MRLGPKVTPEFNRTSGYVFLIDSDFNVAMICEGALEDWLICPECSTEGFASNLADGSPCCNSHANESMD